MSATVNQIEGEEVGEREDIAELRNCVLGLAQRIAALEVSVRIMTIAAGSAFASFSALIIGAFWRVLVGG